MAEDGVVPVDAQTEGGGSVLNAKLARRKLQHDVELLSNRVERLREEERKAKQKVMEMKLRGQEIVAMQKRNEQLKTATALAKRMEEDQLNRERVESRRRRIEDKRATTEIFKNLHEGKRQDVQMERQIKKENAELVRSIKQFDTAKNKQARDSIRSHQKAVAERFEKQRQAHQEFLAQDFINMISMEDKRREEVEKDIADMEIKERQHIEKLRKLQEEQKAAYDALETALASRQ